jgi:hypothetical protein
MRPPRYRFPEEVRSTTRWIAARTVEEGSVAQTPEELEAWIDQAPEARQTLEGGGYHTEFTAHDLFPLYEVFVVKAGGAPARVEAPPPATNRPWVVVMVMVVAVVLVVLAIMAVSRP